MISTLDRRRAKRSDHIDIGGSSSSSNSCKDSHAARNNNLLRRSNSKVVRCDLASAPDISLPRAPTLPAPKRLWTIDASTITQVQEVERERSSNRAKQVQDDLLDQNQVGTRKSGEPPKIENATGPWSMFCDVLPTFLEFFGTMSTFDAAASWIGLGYLALIYAPSFSYPISQSKKHVAELGDIRRYFTYCTASYGPLLCLPKMISTKKDAAAVVVDEKKTGKPRGLQRTLTRLIDGGVSDNAEDSCFEEAPCPSHEVTGGRLAKDIIADHCGLEARDILLYEPHSDWLRPSHFVALADNDRELVISIRGTFSLSDLLVDLSTCQVDIGIDDWGPGHRGFLRGAAEILSSCLRVLRDCEDNQRFAHRLNRVEKITVVGHSLGGATAAYVAMFLQHCLQNPNPLKQVKLPKVHAVTFGCPGVLDARRADSDEARELITS